MYGCGDDDVRASATRRCFPNSVLRKQRVISESADPRTSDFPRDGIASRAQVSRVNDRNARIDAEITKFPTRHREWSENAINRAPLEQIYTSAIRLIKEYGDNRKI